MPLQQPDEWEAVDVVVCVLMRTMTRHISKETDINAFSYYC